MESEPTPPPPPPAKKSKKAKAISINSSKKGKEKMHKLVVEKSELVQEHVTPPPEDKQKKTKASTTKSKIKKPNVEKTTAVGSDGEASDITITKEVQPSGSREIKQMAQVVKRKGS